MKTLPILKHFFALLIAFTSCLLLGCGGCASHEKNTSEKKIESKVEQKKPNKKEVVWNLSPNATATYLYLLYDQALRQGHTEGVAQTLTLLAKHNPPENVYIDAGIMFLDADPKPILPVMQMALKAFPDNVSLNLLNAELLQKAGQSTEAIERIREFSKRHPKNLDAKLELALLLVNAKQHGEAENILNNITGAERTALVEYYHARALIGMNRQDEAIPHLEKAILEMPSFIEALFDLASIYEQEDNYAKSREIYESILDQQGYNPDVIIRLVHSALRLKDPELALEYYAESPMTPGLSATIASMLVEEKYYDLAEPILQKLATLPNPSQDLYFYLAAIAYERDNDTQKTFDYLSKIDKKHQNYQRALLLRLQLLLELQKFEQALTLSQEGMAMYPDKKDFTMTEVRILSTLENNDKALKKSKDMFKKWPDDAEVAFLHASLLDELGQRPEALSVMEGIIKNNPDHHQALNYIGYTLADENRDLERALKLLRKAVALSPKSDYILDSLAWVLYRLGQMEEAFEVISTVVNEYKTEDPVVWEHYGDIASALGKNIEARKGYEKALTFEPKNADDIKKRLSILK